MIKFYNKVFKLWVTRSRPQAIKVRQVHFWSQSLFPTLYTFFTSDTEIKSGLIQLAWEQAPGSYKLDELTFDLSLTCTKGINSAKVRLKPKVSLPNFYGQGPWTCQIYWANCPFLTSCSDLIWYKPTDSLDISSINLQAATLPIPLEVPQVCYKVPQG